MIFTWLPVSARELVTRAPLLFVFNSHYNRLRLQPALIPSHTYILLLYNSPIMPLFLMLVALLSSTLVSACEGDCIEGLTKALIGNYSHSVQTVFSALATDLAEQALLSHSRTKASSILQPALSLYNKQAYESMRAAEFPGFFHGKCQVNNIDPKGCPKPDCPVVCGTPGSIYHFYSTFVHIAYNTTLYGIANSTSSNSTTSEYQAIKKGVLNDNARYKH